MHPIAQKFFSMTPEQKRSVHLFLANCALQQWQKFVERGTVPRSYQENVCGTIQEADCDLPADAMACILKGTDSSRIAERYLEPICALQDNDWQLPDDEQFAYFAIFNMFQKYAINKEVDDWLIVNQALSAFGQVTDVTNNIFEAAVKKFS